MISQVEYKARREELFQNMLDNSVAVLFSAPLVMRSGDSNYRYRQNSDFYYFTGFLEYDAVVVLIKKDSHCEYILFNQENTPHLEIWVGKRFGQERAVSELGADKAYSILQLEETIVDLLFDIENIYYAFGRDTKNDQIVTSWVNQLRTKVRAGVKAPLNMFNLENYSHEMRLIKSPAEQDIIRQVCKLSSKAHVRAMQACKKASNEYQLEAELLYGFSKQGCRYVAYESIVASGKNTCCLHYNDNYQPLKDGDLILIDAGGELHNYGADITRTFPRNGKFSSEQKAIYELVLKAQQAAFDIIKPGIKWYDLQEVVIETITLGLIELGILHGEVKDLISSKAYMSFYMHNSGHWLGLDVHDVGSYKIDGVWRSLQAGMVFTVEPGIYIKDQQEGVDEKWWGIGVRIEDDLLVTEDGFENLTSHLVKEVDEIEALIASA